MEKNGEIKSGTTPPATGCKKSSCGCKEKKSQFEEWRDDLEEHLTKRLADKAKQCKSK